MTKQEALNLINSMGTRYNSGFSYSDKELIKKLYKEVLNLQFVRTSCSDCYRDAYLQIRSYLLKKDSTMEQRKYILRKGVLLRPHFGSSEYYTVNSLTDAKAEEILSKNPALISDFEQFPEDWKTRIRKKSRTAEVEKQKQEQQDKE